MLDVCEARLNSTTVQPMESLNLEVTISHELRALHAASQRDASATVRRDGVGAVKQPPDHMGWRLVNIRVDGSRPKQFLGLPVASFTGAIGSPNGAQCDVVLTVYLSESREGYLSIVVQPPEAIASRPLFACINLTTDGRASAASQCLAKMREMLRQTQFKQGAFDEDFADLSQQFNTITENSFRTERLLEKE